VALFFGLMLPVCVAGYPPVQKGGKQKGGYCEHCFHKKREKHEHPPLAPLVQSVAVMQVQVPDRRVRFRFEQEAGEEPESGMEDDVQTIEERLTILEAKFESLFNSVNALVHQLQPTK
jgi:hypothetical protein